MKQAIAILLALTLALGMSAAAYAGIGAPDARVVVTCLRKDTGPNDPDTLLIVQAIENALDAQGVYIDLTMLDAPSGDYDTEVPKQIVAGQLNADIIYFENDSDIDCVATEMLDNLMPFIDESRNVAGLLEAHSKARLKNWPYLLWLAPAEVSVPVMRSDLLAQAQSGAALRANPSVDAYYNVLKELKDARAIEYGIAFTDISQLDSIFAHAFGVTGTIMHSGEGLVYSCVTDANRDKLRFYAKLYSAGLIAPDYTETSYQSMAQDFYSGKAALIADTAGAAIDAHNARQTETHGAAAELTVLQPAAGIGCAYLSVDTSKEHKGFALNPYSDVKDAAFAVLEYMASADGRKLDILGAEGTHYTVSPDGVIQFTSAHESYWPRFFPTISGLPTLSYATELISNPARDSLILAQNYYMPDTIPYIAPELQSAYDAAMQLYQTESEKFIKGERPITDWPDFVSEFNATGGTLLAEYITNKLS